MISDNQGGNEGAGNEVHAGEAAMGDIAAQLSNSFRVMLLLQRALAESTLSAYIRHGGTSCILWWLTYMPQLSSL